MVWWGVLRWPVALVCENSTVSLREVNPLESIFLLLSGIFLSYYRTSIATKPCCYRVYVAPALYCYRSSIVKLSVSYVVMQIYLHQSLQHRLQRATAAVNAERYCSVFVSSNAFDQRVLDPGVT